MSCETRDEMYLRHLARYCQTLMTLADMLEVIGHEDSKERKEVAQAMNSCASAIAETVNHIIGTKEEEAR